MDAREHTNLGERDVVVVDDLARRVLDHGVEYGGGAVDRGESFGAKVEVLGNANAGRHIEVHCL